jgi:heme o synthase
MTDAAIPARTAARWQDYVQLLKPRVMSLVVFTALTGMVCAPTPLNWAMAPISLLCIAIGAGASGALNMWYDADIDAKMRRTRGRPVPAGKIAPGDAMALGVVLSLFSVMLMAMASGWLAAGLLAFTILFYAVVYTVWLKRRTAQNIVIGGLAGALPPVIGWASASGAAPLDAWILCGIIFLWTPPHFWALSLYTRQDYAAAGVPMLPVVAGAKETRKQILLYSLALVAAGFAPYATGLGGRVYLAVASVGGLAFLVLAWRLFRSRAGDGERDDASGLYTVGAGPKDARNLFAFSIFYLFGLFAALLVEQLGRLG